MVEASPRRVFANAHTYHVNSISVNSDGETYLSTDDLRINLWNLEITDCSFSILESGFDLMVAGFFFVNTQAFRLSSLPRPLQILWTSNRPTWRS